MILRMMNFGAITILIKPDESIQNAIEKLSKRFKKK